MIFLMISIFYLTQGQDRVALDPSMKCGECIYYGYNSCTKDIDHRIVNDTFESILGFPYDPLDTNYNICYS